MAKADPRSLLAGKSVYYFRFLRRYISRDPVYIAMEEYFKGRVLAGRRWVHGIICVCWSEGDCWQLDYPFVIALYALKNKYYRED